MKIQKIALIFFVIIIVGMSWKVYSYLNPNYEKCFTENKEQFNFNRQKFNKIITQIENNYLQNWDGQNQIELTIENIDIPSKTILNDLGIGSIIIESNPSGLCRKKYWITLNVVENWNIKSLNVVQIVYAPCCESTNFDYHYYDGYHRDEWGLGGDWVIYSDTDFI